MDLSSLPSNGLARLCSDAGSDDAWQEFVRRFQRPVALSVMRTARLWGSRSTDLLDDLVQETFLRLCADNCRLLKSFVPRDHDSIVGFLKVIASNATHDHFRSQNSQKHGGQLHRFEQGENDLEFLISVPGPATDPERILRMQEIDKALQALMPDPVTDRDRTIFWLYFQQGFSAREIAGLPAIHISVKGVESSIHRSTQLLREAMTKCS
jgi:RNA polymerase sigma-70 factor (ECF subfamily)